ncbi:MAG TPA: hypothetical protein VGQ37_13095 [Vicinamibacterales bacterium]|jgi:hypothetical protein|nr:hypothetical protein [Vicinamibacterales bacterium]
MALRIALLVVALLSSAVAAQSPLPPTATAAEVATYEAFRVWITKQPVAIQNADDTVVFERYAAELRGQGKGDRDIASTIASLKSMGDRAEIERWNRILTAPQPRFNTAPNAFLASVTTGLKPGRSLDVGMGQGPNTIYLAQKGWDSAGFDPADRAVVAAQEQAATLGVKSTVFDTNELLRIFAPLRVVRYENADAKGDFGGQNDTRVVRLAAIK